MYSKNFILYRVYNYCVEISNPVEYILYYYIININLYTILINIKIIGKICFFLLENIAHINVFPLSSNKVYLSQDFPLILQLHDSLELPKKKPTFYWPVACKRSRKISMPGDLEAVSQRRISEVSVGEGPVRVANRWPMNPGLVSVTIVEEEVTFLSTLRHRPRRKKENSCIVNSGWDLLVYAIRPLRAAGVWELLLWLIARWCLPRRE